MSDDVVRLKRWKNYFEDGRSYAEIGVKQKDEVAVFVYVGNEPLKIKDKSDLLDINSIILDMAEQIKKANKEIAKKKKAAK